MCSIASYFMEKEMVERALEVSGRIPLFPVRISCIIGDRQKGWIGSRRNAFRYFISGAYHGVPQNQFPRL